MTIATAVATTKTMVTTKITIVTRITTTVMTKP